MPDSPSKADMEKLQADMIHKFDSIVPAEMPKQPSSMLKQLAQMRRSQPSIQLIERTADRRKSEVRNALRTSTSSLPSPPFVESDAEDQKVEKFTLSERPTTVAMISVPHLDEIELHDSEHVTGGEVVVENRSEDMPEIRVPIKSPTPTPQHILPNGTSSTSIDTEMSNTDAISTSPNEWSINGVITWLTTTFAISDTAVLEAFRDNDIDGHVLFTAVNDSALKDDLKVKSFGKRARILQAISKIKIGTMRERETSSSSDDEIQHSPRKRKRTSRSVRPLKRHQYNPIRRMDIQEVEDDLVNVQGGKDDIMDVQDTYDFMSVPKGKDDSLSVHSYADDVDQPSVKNRRNLEVDIHEQPPSLTNYPSESTPHGTKRKRAVLSTMPLPITPPVQVVFEGAHTIPTNHENMTESSDTSQTISSRRRFTDASVKPAKNFKVVRGLLEQPDITDESLEQTTRMPPGVSKESVAEHTQEYSWSGLLQKYLDLPPGELLPVYGESDEEITDSDLEREMQEDVIAEQNRAVRLQRKRELRQARREIVSIPDPVNEDAEINIDVETQPTRGLVDNSEDPADDREEERAEIESIDVNTDASHVEVDSISAGGPQPRLHPMRQNRVSRLPMGDLSAEEAGQILEECIVSFRQDWFVHRLPREEAQAHRNWKKESGRELDLKAELEHLQTKRLSDQKEAILVNDFNSKDEIFKQAKALEPTIHFICRLEWILGLISMPQPDTPRKTSSSKADTVRTGDEMATAAGDDGVSQKGIEAEHLNNEAQKAPDFDSNVDNIAEIEVDKQESKHSDDDNGDDDMADFIVEDDDNDEGELPDPTLIARDRIIDKARAARRVSSQSLQGDADSNSSDNVPVNGRHSLPLSAKPPAETRPAESLPLITQASKTRMIAKKTVPRIKPRPVSISSDDEEQFNSNNAPFPSDDEEQPKSNENQDFNKFETDSDSAFPPANTVLERSIKKRSSIGSSSQQNTPTAKPRRSAVDSCADELIESMLKNPSPEVLAFVTSGRKMETEDMIVRDAFRNLREQYKIWSTTVRPSTDFLDSENDPIQDLKAFARYYLSRDITNSAPPVSPSPTSQLVPKDSLQPRLQLASAKKHSLSSKSPKGKSRALDMEVVELSSDEDEDRDNNASQLTVYKPLSPKANKKRRHKNYALPVEQGTKKAQDKQKRQEKAIANRIQKQQHAGQTFEMEGSIMINPGHKLGEDSVWVTPSLSKALKPHQIEGIKFLWKNIIMIGNGCILAHDMGLGKTLQVITFIVTLMHQIANEHSVPTGLKPARILILCPPSVIDNWCNEFEKWIPKSSDLWYDGVRSVSKMDNFQHLTSYDREESKLDQLEAWYEAGGIFVMSYDMYKSNVLNRGKYHLLEDQMVRVNKYLVDPGPSMVVCDEGHVLRNKDGRLLEAVRKMSTKSRICLTGYPVQNNLLEYWAMLDFAHPGYLGSDMSFQYRFVYPIRDGMYCESTPQEKKTMHKKSFVLHGIIASKIFRESISVLKDILPSKTEYRIQVELTTEQKELYNAAIYYMTIAGTWSRLFANADLVQAICNHPRQLAKKLEEHAKKHKLQASDQQLAIESPTTVDSPVNDDGTLEGMPPAENLDPSKYAWASEILARISDVHAATLSNKILVSMDIIRQCHYDGEKVLFFCHSHAILDLMEQLLGAEPNLNYMRFDGKTVVNKRQSLISEFNTSVNCSVFLLSTRATSLGVNIASASRVILYDIHWKPSHEAQAIGRAYRLGQQKPVVVYRISTWGTFETKMSEQAELKQHLATRVVDQRNTKHHINRDAERYFVPVLPPPIHVDSVKQSILNSINDDELKVTFNVDPVLLRALRGKNEMLTDVRLSEITNAPTFDFSEAELAALLEEIERGKEGKYDDVHELNDTAGARQGPAPAPAAVNTPIFGEAMQYAVKVMDELMKSINPQP